MFGKFSLGSVLNGSVDSVLEVTRHSREQLRHRAVGLCSGLADCLQMEMPDPHRKDDN
jgi:hypothetical protein